MLDCKFAPQPIVFATTMKPHISHADIYAITILHTGGLPAPKSHFANRSHVRHLHVEEPWPKHPSKCLSGLWGHGALAKEFAIKSTPGPFCPFWSPPPTMMVIVFLRLRRPAGVVCVRGRQSNINDHFLPPTALCSPPCQVPCMHVQYVLYLDHRYASRRILYLTTI